MNVSFLQRWAAAAGVASVLWAGGLLRADAPPTAPTDDAGPGVEVLARGPIHEAFARPVDGNPEPGPVISKQPPAPVNEVPPDQKPAGSVIWIPGYWAWDPDRTDFIWVSGVWRQPPPNHTWVPGYWQQVADGWQWVAGFWKPAAQERTIYLPDPPPASIDNGPSSPAPDDTSFYIPGNWVSQDDSYAWQPGSWATYQPGWVWNRADYNWTPSGYVYTAGYWDYPLDTRGELFAPVAYSSPVYADPGYVYQPSYCWNVGTQLTSLFICPRWHSYCWGDYYGSRYRDYCTPWYSYGRRCGDSLFNYYSAYHYQDAGWYDGLRSTYLGRRDGLLDRPPVTLAQQNVLINQHVGDNVVNNINNTNINNTTINHIGNNRALVPLAEQARLNRGAFTKTDPAAYRTHVDGLRQASLQRQRFETAPGTVRPNWNRQAAGLGATGGGVSSRSLRPPTADALHPVPGRGLATPGTQYPARPEVRRPTAPATTGYRNGSPASTLPAVVNRQHPDLRTPSPRTLPAPASQSPGRGYPSFDRSPLGTPQRPQVRTPAGVPAHSAAPMPRLNDAVPQRPSIQRPAVTAPRYPSPQGYQPSQRSYSPQRPAVTAPQYSMPHLNQPQGYVSPRSTPAAPPRAAAPYGGSPAARNYSAPARPSQPAFRMPQAVPQTPRPMAAPPRASAPAAPSFHMPQQQPRPMAAPPRASAPPSFRMPQQPPRTMASPPRGSPPAARPAPAGRHH